MEARQTIQHRSVSHVIYDRTSVVICPLIYVQQSKQTRGNVKYIQTFFVLWKSSVAQLEPLHLRCGYPGNVTYKVYSVAFTNSLISTG